MAIIAMSAAPGVADIDASFEGGVHSFLGKPFPSLDDLLLKVETALRDGRKNSRMRTGSVNAVHQLLTPKGQDGPA